MFVYLMICVFLPRLNLLHNIIAETVPDLQMQVAQPVCLTQNSFPCCFCCAILRTWSKPDTCCICIKL